MRAPLSVVVPAWQEGERIVAAVRTILAFAAAAPRPVEVLVCDDGSTDGTAARLANAALPQVRVLAAPHAGKGAAVRRGVLAASHDLVLVTDADLSVPLAELDRLEPALDHAPVVIGSKHVRGRRARWPWRRRLGSWLGRAVITTLVVRGFTDTQCGFKLLRRDAAQRLFALQRLDGFGFDFEVLFLARRLGIAVVEVPVEVAHRGDSSVRLRAYVQTLREVGELWLHRVRGRYPPAPPPV